MLVAPLVSRAARRRWRRVRAAVPGYAFIAPAMAGIVLFGLAPLVYAFVVSLHAYDLVNRHPPFVGPANYSRLLTDPVFWGALRNTLVYTVMLVPLQTATGLGLALLVQQPTRWIALLRTAYFLPVVISYVVAAGLWQVLFATPNGPMNSLLALVRIPPQLFFLSQTQALPLIALMSAWKWSGVSMLVYLGGLHEIPLELYEASRVDGAAAAIFRHYLAVAAAGDAVCGGRQYDRRVQDLHARVRHHPGRPDGRHDGPRVSPVP